MDAEADRSTPIDCPACHAKTLDLRTGVQSFGLTAVLIPPTFPCSGCGAEWMLGELVEPGAVEIPEGFVLVPVGKGPERRR